MLLATGGAPGGSMSAALVRLGGESGRTDTEGEQTCGQGDDVVVAVPDDEAAVYLRRRLRVTGGVLTAVLGMVRTTRKSAHQVISALTRSWAMLSHRPRSRK